MMLKEGGGENMHNRSQVIAHFKEHQKYPAQKTDLIRNCENLSDLEPEDRQWLRESLGEQRYKTAGDVIERLGW
jgi:hypothetical protein